MSRNGFVCSNCGASDGERCDTCGRALMCGSVAEPCDADGCGRTVLARKYEPDCRLADGAPTYEAIDQEAHRRGVEWTRVVAEYAGESGGR